MVICIWTRLESLHNAVPFLEVPERRRHDKAPRASTATPPGSIRSSSSGAARQLRLSHIRAISQALVHSPQLNFRYLAPQTFVLYLSHTHIPCPLSSTRSRLRPPARATPTPVPPQARATSPPTASNPTPPYALHSLDSCPVVFLTSYGWGYRRRMILAILSHPSLEAA